MDLSVQLAQYTHVDPIGAQWTLSKADQGGLGVQWTPSHVDLGVQGGLQNVHGDRVWGGAVIYGDLQWIWSPRWVIW